MANARPSVNRVAASKLFRRFSNCAEGHGVLDVIEAAGFTLAVGIYEYATRNGLTEAQANDYARFICGNVRNAVIRGYKIGPLPRGCQMRLN